LLLLGGLLVIALGWVGFRVVQAYSDLLTSEELLTQLQGELLSVQDLNPDTQATLTELQDTADSARSAAHDPFFRAAARLPWVGDDLMAARRLADVVGALADQVMPQVVELRSTLSLAAVLPTGHTVDLTPLAGMAPKLDAVAVQVNSLLSQIETISLSDLSDRAAREVSAAHDRLQSARDQLQIGSALVAKLPAILGFDGPRTYLLVFQNNAEARATGGMFGSFAVVTADHGTISLGDPDRSARELPTLDQGLPGYDPALTSFYGDLVARDARYTNMTPDFPTAARSFAEIYQQRTGNTVDGVLATDPVALGYLLGGQSPVDVGNGVWLDSGTAADFFLSGIYAKFGTDAVARETFTASATQVLADKILGGGLGADLASGVRRGLDEHRILAWSAHQDEEQVIAGTSVGGAVANDPGSTEIGVFLNDGSGVKLSYYLHPSLTVTAGDCTGPGVRRVTVQVALQDGSPSSGLTDYVASWDKVPPYVLRTTAVLMVPTNGTFVGATQDGQPAAVTTGVDHGRSVTAVTVDLQPGQASTLTYQLDVPAVGGVVTPTVRFTPLRQAWAVDAAPFAGCP